MEYNIKFDKKNSNSLIVKKDGKVNYICCPPIKSGCDIISFNKPVNKGYAYNFDGLIIITSQIKFLWIKKTYRKVYFKGVLLDSIIF